VLFLRSHAGASCTAKDRSNFLSWAQRQAAHGDDRTETVAAVDRKVLGSWDKAVCAEIESRNDGMVLIGRNRLQAWRERLFYSLRHKVIALISPNPRLRHVTVLLDFSDTSLLALTFVRHAFLNRPEFKLHFLHALHGNEKSALRRWSRHKRVADIDPEAALTLLPSTGNPSATILEALAAGRYGTIVMGKRGLSGIKRLLLGSVSRAVLRRMDDRSLFLVD